MIYPGSQQPRRLFAATHRGPRRASQAGLAEVELLVGPRSMSIARSPVLMLNRRVGAELCNRLREVIVIAHFAS